ncbi:MAG: fibronectin type III domain-containing protein, partial [Bacteroidota bacterium]|nr:fibronectin type III domain-containing protein [Bacteroidota bacterium]
MKIFYIIFLYLLTFNQAVFGQIANKPTTPASNIGFSSVTNNSVNVSWTNGNGSRRLVLAIEKNNFNSFFFPKDGSSYTGNATFKSGSNLGYNTFVVYNGTGSNVTVNGLAFGTSYNFTVIEYNGTGSQTSYLVQNFPTGNVVTAGPTEPTVAASNIIFSSITNNTVDMSWTNGNGQRRLVLAVEKTSIESFFFPKDGSSFTSNSTFKLGSNVGYKMYVVYDGNGNSVSINGLFNGTQYNFTVLEYNGSGNETNYLLSPFPSGGFMTTGPTEPTIRTSNINFTNRTQNSVQVNWTNGNGQNRIVLVRAANTTDTYFSPQDGRVYTANSTFGAGEYIGWVDASDKRHFVVYNGSGNSFTLTGLQPDTDYYFAIFEYNGTGITSNYKVDIFPQNPNPTAKTIATKPTVNATNLNISNITNNSMNLSWTNGNGSRRMVIASTNPISSSYLPRDGRDYLANSIFGSGSSLGNNTFAVFKSTGSSFTLSGLNSGTQYYIAVIEINGSGSSNNYLTTGYLTGSEFTSGIRTPTTNASNLIFSNIANNSFQVNWTNGNGERRLIIISPNSLNNFHFPKDGQEYIANSNFGSGSNLGNNTFVVYNG